MGTSGHGNLSDYPGGHTGGGGVGAGSGEQDRCRQVMTFDLEDVARSEYFVSVSSLPPAGTAVRLTSKLVDQRLAVDAPDGRVLGLVPTRYNFIAIDCLPNGVQYAEEVVASSLLPVPTVTVRLTPL